MRGDVVLHEVEVFRQSVDLVGGRLFVELDHLALTVDLDAAHAVPGCVHGLL